MKIAAVFSDYDGTLASADVSRESSSLSKDTEAALERLSSVTPVAIVTSKDIRFIRPRTPFASAWACVSGLEIVLADGVVSSSPQVNSRLEEGLEYVRQHDKTGLSLERKCDVKGKLLGFSVDWRKATTPTNDFVATTSSRLAAMGLTVVHEPSWTFIDVFGKEPDKGRAVRELRRLLKVKGNVLFLGDSTPDNSAFEESDLSVCIEHGQGLEGLACGFVIPFDKLGALLRNLAEDDLLLDLGSLEKNNVA